MKVQKHLFIILLFISWAKMEGGRGLSVLPGQQSLSTVVSSPPFSCEPHERVVQRHDRITSQTDTVDKDKILDRRRFWSAGQMCAHAIENIWSLLSWKQNREQKQRFLKRCDHLTSDHLKRGTSHCRLYMRYIQEVKHMYRIFFFLDTWGQYVQIIL